MKRKTHLIITVSVIVGLLLLNVLATVVSNIRLMYIDMTTEKYRETVYEYNSDGTRKRDSKGNYISEIVDTGNTMYTLSEECRELIASSVPAKIDEVNAGRASAGEDALKVHIVFCMEPDKLDENTTTRYVRYTALCIADAFPDYIDVSYINMRNNPSAVQKYKANSASNIYSSNVIIEFGTEYRVYQLKSMFTFSETDSDTPWAYNGEKKFASGIMAVTRAESPICCLTSNHGEEINLDSTFVKLIRASGYEVRTLDLYREEIPEDCRLIITVNPQTDFIAYGSDGYEGISEITKLDKYLDKAYSFIFIFDPDTPTLFNLDSYLKAWGVRRGGETNAADVTGYYTLTDEKQSLDASGSTLIANYATGGAGASLTEDMRETGYPSKVVFGNTGCIQPSDSYVKSFSNADDTSDTASSSLYGTLETEEEKEPDFIYYTYNKNGVIRYMYDVFDSSANAVAKLDGSVADSATEKDRFKLMTITRESRNIQEDNYSSVSDSSYVCAIASTEFISDEVLNSPAYGNTDVLLGTMRTLSKEIVPVGLGFKAFRDTEIDENSYSSEKAVTATVWLAVTPAVALFTCGVIVNVRRKYL